MKTLAYTPLRDNDRQAIEAAVRLLHQRFPVVRVILYGSKARGTADEESDIDLLVLTSREITWQERDAITDALFDIQLACNVVISTLVVPDQEWSAGRYVVLPIHSEIEQEGVAV
jgi:predicted nucleotidyltransferase